MSRPISWFRIVALGCTALSGLACARPALSRDAPQFVTSAPEDFSALVQDRTILIDVYFGGLRRGEATVSVSPDKLTLLDPAGLLALFPELKDGQSIAQTLNGASLPAHAELVCTQTTDPRKCGQLSPETVGIILDRDRFRMDVFFNPVLLKVEDRIDQRYLPSSADDFSLISTIGAVLSGGGRAGGEYFNLQDQLIAGWGNRRLRGDLSYASDIGLGVDRLQFEWDRPEVRYLGGAIRARGSSLFGQRKLIGAGLETQIDTRLDKDLVAGSPIVIFLDRRARVDVLRDGRIFLRRSTNREISNWIHPICPRGRTKSSYASRRGGAIYAKKGAFIQRVGAYLRKDGRIFSFTAGCWRTSTSPELSSLPEKSIFRAEVPEGSAKHGSSTARSRLPAAARRSKWGPRFSRD